MQRYSKINTTANKQGSLEQWALLFALLLLLFWEKVAPMAKGFLCECQSQNESESEEIDNTIDLPQTVPGSFGQSFEINKEEFERMNDLNVFNIEPSTLVTAFDHENDTLKIIQNGIPT
ncbi:hypothetical protein [Christiangramia sp. SM2212]|uniref:Uncharacterized protein n=1 Tax=Christiangramia sediminicola TaxID=3073267 RepID=A0ABU1EPD9_9FLAO|nr:hypothetical protein [Christiangramia sp. SM2212]MDR5590254.1 hypothetical protein [Christiangramia sp. SM2212]